MDFETLLLNYMYQKGFTEEDMYDENTVSKVRKSFGFLAFRVARGVVVLFEKVKEVVKNLWNQIKDIGIKVDEKTGAISLKQPKQEKVFWPAKLDTRIRSQVLNNKPRHQIRKIIR